MLTAHPLAMSEAHYNYDKGKYQLNELCLDRDCTIHTALTGIDLTYDTILR